MRGRRRCLRGYHAVDGNINQVGDQMESGSRIRSPRLTVIWVVFFILQLIMTLDLPAVLAQEAGGEQFKATAGPYEIRVTTITSNISLGQVSFAVTVVDVATGQPVPGASVTAKLTWPRKYEPQ